MVLQQSSSTYPRPPCCSNDEQWLLFKSGWYLHNPQIVWKFNSDKRLSLFQTAFKRIYIYGWFLTFLFLQSLHTISLEIYVEQSQVFVHYRQDEKQKAFIYRSRVFNLQRFARERVYTGNELFNKIMHLSAVNLHDWRPSSVSTPKISHMTKNGQWLGVNNKGNHTTHTGSF